MDQLPRLLKLICPLFLARYLLHLSFCLHVPFPLSCPTFPSTVVPKPVRALHSAPHRSFGFSLVDSVRGQGGDWWSCDVCPPLVGYHPVYHCSLPSNAACSGVLRLHLLCEQEKNQGRRATGCTSTRRARGRREGNPPALCG